MRPIQLVRRSLNYYWRTNLAVVLGVATAVAVLAGALLVGDSVRGSLRDLVLQRLGRTDRLVTSAAFFREALASDLLSDPGLHQTPSSVCPLIVMPGTVTDQDTGRRASRVLVYGVDDRFWGFHGVVGPRGPIGRNALLSRALAADIGATPEHAVLVRVERPSAIPVESLHGRKEDLGRTLRLSVRAVIGAAEMGDFSLQAQQGDVRAVFVPLRRLQEDLGVAGRVNALLVFGAPALDEVIQRRFALEDVGLSIRGADEMIVESAAGLLDAPRARAAEEAATAAGLRAQTVLTYLANTMKSGDRELPYSLVSGLDLNLVVPGGLGDGHAIQAGGAPPIVINEWVAQRLGAGVGDPLSLEYYVWEEPGRLTTRTADFTVAAVVPIAGLAASRDLAPVYPGITEAKTLSDWDPPFPIYLRRMGPDDEDYWEKYRTTPKAFVPLEVGQRLWASRFGDRTSVRVRPRDEESPTDARSRYAAALRARINPSAFGLTARAVREESLRAARGATDFGQYFTYFSTFLVASALLLAVLFFRLSVEQRARETGLLRAIGLSPGRVRRLFLAEGFVLGGAGAAIGVVGAILYGALMMLGLRTWWSGAVGTTALRLHVDLLSLVAGAAGALLAAMLCIWWTLRRLSHISERALLAGTVTQAFPPPVPGKPQRRAGRARKSAVQLSAASVAGWLCALLALELVISGALGWIDRTAAFFGSGTLLLVACLCLVAARLRRPPRSAFDGFRWRALPHMGVRNAADRPGRSVLAIGVIASATFLIVAVGAFRREVQIAGDRYSGTGGYNLLVDLLLPLVHDPNSRDGREALGLNANQPVHIEPFRVLPGDDASCLNLYTATNPRVLGVSRAFVDGGRFAFQSSLATTVAERTNPWGLLNQDLGQDVVPAIADANSMTYVLHKKLGDEVEIAAAGRPLRLRLVAALADSIFQRELLIAEDQFVRRFPDEAGYRFLLIEGQASDAAIEQGASDLGADAIDTSARLAEFHTVENTYLATFQALGGLGLLVGTLGLSAVVLRNVLERRRELALLGAVGYSRGAMFVIVIAENLLLLGWGLVIGIVSALVAIAPAALERGGRPPATDALGLLLFVVFLAGLLSSVVATRAALRTPLLQALRSE